MRTETSTSINGGPTPHPLWEKAHNEGRTVRVDSLRAGISFLTMDGEIWTYTRPDGALEGVYHSERHTDGFRSVFAGCADVLIVAKEGVR